MNRTGTHHTAVHQRRTVKEIPKSGPNGLNKKHPAGVGGNLGARSTCGPLSPTRPHPRKRNGAPRSRAPDFSLGPPRERLIFEPTHNGADPASISYRPRFPSISRRTALISSKTSSLDKSPFRTFLERSLLSSTFGRFASNRHPLASKKRITHE